jgi:hypothetical protein
MMFWPVGDYYDNTTRLVGGSFDGYESMTEAQVVIDQILSGQRKHHHVVYRIESAESLKALENSGVLV